MQKNKGVTKMFKIVLLDSMTLGSDIDLSMLKSFGDVEIFEKTLDSQIQERIYNKDIVLVNKVSLKEVLKSQNKLKLICILATGTNNVDLELAKEKNIAVTNVAGYSTASVAQHTFAMLLYIVEKLRYYDEYVKNGDYCNSECFTHLGRDFYELSGKTFGIIGLGEIGRTVGNIAKAFGCKVLYYSTSGKNNSNDFERVDKGELFKNSDIISIHAPLNENTRNLIGYAELREMKREAILLNLGRGGIVKESDLVRALNENIISAAALDVLEVEPMKKDSPFFDLVEKEKLFVTPHIAWASIEARKRLLNEVVLNIEAFINGEKRNRVV
jgi:glycerate dehydrogenase